MDPSSPEPRRISTPSWLDLRLVLGLVLVLASVVIGATLVSRASDTRAAVTATRDLAAGTILRRDDLSVTQVKVDNEKVYLGKVEDAVGKTLGRAVSAHELVPAAAVARIAALTKLIVPLAAGAAPTLHDGERIEVWLSSASCASVVLLPDVTVQEVRTDTSGSFTNGTGGQDVVLSVPQTQAGRVVAALAIDGAQIRAGVLIGRSPVAPGTLPVPSSPAASAAPSGSTPPAGALPPDLAGCASASTGS